MTRSVTGNRGSNYGPIQPNAEWGDEVTHSLGDPAYAGASSLPRDRTVCAAVDSVRSLPTYHDSLRFFQFIETAGPGSPERLKGSVDYDPRDPYADAFTKPARTFNLASGKITVR